MEELHPNSGKSPDMESFNSTYLLLFDFDGTQAQTFKPSPSGVGVEENYENTIREIFGDEILDTYNEQGGLQNRNPIEVIHDLFEIHPEMLEQAKSHLNKNKSELTTVMPETVHFLDSWDESPLKSLNEVYVRQDLINSLGHIGLINSDGSVWPKPTEGFDSFWQKIHELNDGNYGFSIDTAVISSGYTEYIAKTFDVWGQPYPNIWITDNETRKRKFPEEHEKRVKPAPFAVSLAHHAWLKAHGKTGPDFDLSIAEESKDRMFLFGDGISKDGGMAIRSRIGFGHFNPEVAEIQHGEHSTFSNWEDIENQIIANMPALAQGLAIAKIIRGEI
jgi:hypothetical protein